MNPVLKYILVLTLAGCLALWMGGKAHWQGVSLFSGVVFVSILSAWLTKYPWVWIACLALYAEVRSALPAGVVTVMVVWPILWKLWISGEPDGSRRFWWAVGITIMCQILTIVLGEWWLAAGRQWAWWVDLPWLGLAAAWATMTVISGGTVWLIYAVWWPHDAHGIATIDQQKVKYL